MTTRACADLHVQLFPIPGQAQAKIEDMSRRMLSGVSKMHSNMPTSLLTQVSANTGSQTLAGMGQRLAVRTCVDRCRRRRRHCRLSQTTSAASRRCKTLLSLL